MNKFLLLVLLASSSAFAGYLQPKYKCIVDGLDPEEPKKTIIVTVSEEYLCGEENKDYEMALVKTEADPHSSVLVNSVQTGTISYSNEDFTVTATVKASFAGKTFNMPLTMDLSKDGKKDNASFEQIYDMDDNMLPIYKAAKATCSTAVTFNMDC